jgi:hypothetical protein
MLVEMAISAGASLLLTAAYLLAFRERTRPFRASVFSAILLAAAFSGGLLMRTAGPAPGGVYWLPILLLIALLALLLAASIPRKPPQYPDEVARRLDNERAVKTSIRILSILLATSVIVATVVHHLARQANSDKTVDTGTAMTGRQIHRDN